MKRKIITKIIATMLLVSSICSFFSCVKEKEPEPYLVDLSGYTVIRSESADSKVMKAMDSFLDQLKETSGLDLEWDTDYLKSGATLPESAKEILIGFTNRPESQNLRYYEFSISYQNSRISISAGSGEAAEKAVEYFFQNCLSGTTATIPAKGYTENYQTYPLENVKLCGIALSEFTVAKVKGEADEHLREWLGKNAGTRVDNASGHVITLTGDAHLTLDEVSFTETENGAFALSYSSFFNYPEIAVNWLIEKITNEKSENITMENVEKVTVPDSVLEGIVDVHKIQGTAYFRADTDKDPMGYTVGDEIVFNVSLLSGGKTVSCPKFTWYAYTDNGKSYSGTVDGKYGRFIVRIPATATGAIRLETYAREENGTLISNVTQSESLIEPAVFGAIVNANRITVSVAEPNDFDSFWNAQYSAVKAVNPDVTYMEKFTPNSNQVSRTDGTGSASNFNFYRIKIATPSDCGYVSAILSVPKNATANSCGITVVFNGYGVGDLNPYIAANQMVLNVCAHSIELGKSSSYYSGLSLSNYCFTNETKEASYFRTMVMRDLQALRFAKAYAGTTGVKINGSTQSLGIWNGNLKLYGGSQGAFQGIAVAALDHDVTEAFWWIPWMCDVGATTVEKMGSGFRPQYTPALRYFDSLYFAKRIDSKVYVTMQIGLGDYICPPSGTVALYNTLNCHVSCEFKQGMTHGYTPQTYSTYVHKKN